MRAEKGQLELDLAHKRMFNLVIGDGPCFSHAEHPKTLGGCRCRIVINPLLHSWPFTSWSLFNKSVCLFFKWLCLLGGFNDSVTHKMDSTTLPGFRWVQRVSTPSNVIQRNSCSQSSDTYTGIITVQSCFFVFSLLSGNSYMSNPYLLHPKNTMILDRTHFERSMKNAYSSKRFVETNYFFTLLSNTKPIYSA